MPALTIQGKKFNRVLDAKVEISHGNAREATQVPAVQFVINLPLEDETYIADWALAPHGPNRWKTVELTTTDRSRDTNHSWTMNKAYVHEYREKEFPEGSGGATDQGNYITIIVRGVLMHTNLDYDGKNIVAVKPGKQEVKPS